MRSKQSLSSGQGYWSRFQTCSAAESGDISMPIAPGSIFRLPHPTSRTIPSTLTHRLLDIDPGGVGRNAVHGELEVGFAEAAEAEHERESYLVHAGELAG